MTANLDSQRQTALATMERQQTMAKVALFAAVGAEGLLLFVILSIIDFSNTMHRLVFLCAILSYLPLALGMMGLAAMINRHSRMILHGLQMMSEERG
jgi:hypothetical protein